MRLFSTPLNSITFSQELEIRMTSGNWYFTRCFLMCQEMQFCDTHSNPKFPVGHSMCLTTIFSTNFFQEVKDQLDSPDFVNTFWLCLWCTKGVLIYHIEKWRLCKGGCEETVPTLVSIMYVFAWKGCHVWRKLWHLHKTSEEYLKYP